MVDLRFIILNEKMSEINNGEWVFNMLQKFDNMFIEIPIFN